MLGQVETLWNELSQRRKAWQSECELAERQFAEREAAIQRQSAELHAERTRLEQLAQSLTLHAEADHAGETARSQAIFDEILQLRRVVESLADKIAERPAAASPAQPAESPPRIDTEKRVDTEMASEKPKGDPVLDSVMAQFETLQKDLSRRHGAGTNPT
jgi:DNA repair exonuclease SbcCD ATPase subunit